MNILNLEIYSLCIILVITIDYLSKYQKKLTKNSYIFLIMICSIIISSIVNIVIFISNQFINLKTIMFFIGYIAIAIPPLCLNTYMKINAFNEKKEINSIIKNNILFLIIYIVFNAVYFYFNRGIINYNVEFLFENNNNYTFLICLLPLLLSLIEAIKLRIKNELIIDIRLLCAVILPIIGIVKDFIDQTITLTLPLYILSLIILYIYRNEFDLNNDRLTGLYNRRILDRKKSGVKDKIMAIYMIDLDRFKYINDTFGHNYGDQVLIDVSDIIRKSIRNTDYPIRIGGDEFMIIAVIGNIKDIDAIPRKINKNLSIYNKKAKTEVSLSIGYDAYNPKYNNWDELIEKIDKKLYKEKEKHHKKQKS